MLRQAQHTVFAVPWACRRVRTTKYKPEIYETLKMPYMYILKCSDNSYYTGSTRNIETRLYQHETGKGSKYTSTRLPIELVCLEEYERIDEAYAREKQVQGWSRKKKEALMNNKYDKLPELSRNASTSSAQVNKGNLWEVCWACWSI